MTEEEWLSNTVLDKFYWPLDVSRNPFAAGLGRKTRLFLVACCRQLAHMTADPAFCEAITCAERYVEGETTNEDLAMARLAIDGAWDATQDPATNTNESSEQGLIAAIFATASPEAFDPDLLFRASEGSLHAARSIAELSVPYGYMAGPEGPRPENKLWEVARDEHRWRQVPILRDVFGPLLFRPTTLNPAWLSSTVLSLAQGIYEDRAFDRMPILADALQDSGCDSEDILTHCRGPGPHVRGCWVTDLLTGRRDSGSPASCTPHSPSRS